MLFNSRLFILGFLPLALGGYFLIGRNRSHVLCWLLACSLVFYGWWKPPMLTLLLASIIVNFTIARFMAGAANRKAWLVTGPCFNLGLLGLFKYAPLIGVTGVVLPLGISFFTFQQITPYR